VGPNVVRSTFHLGRRSFLAPRPFLPHYQILRSCKKLNSNVTITLAGFPCSGFSNAGLNPSMQTRRMSNHQLRDARKVSSSTLGANVVQPSERLFGDLRWKGHVAELRRILLPEVEAPPKRDITLTFEGGATNHFGSQAIYGVVRRADPSSEAHERE
jgi:hypothetical protein